MDKKIRDADKEVRREMWSEATFAGGCFWCLEASFEQNEGVMEAIAGYAGGTSENPTYEEVATGRTGHAEAVQVKYDPGKVSYEELLDIFWDAIDPTDAGGQYVDRGSQYRTIIFYHNEEQRQMAEMSKKLTGEKLKLDKPVVTEIVRLDKFYEAEEEHQDFYKKAPERYKRYKEGSGRK